MLKETVEQQNNTEWIDHTKKLKKEKIVASQLIVVRIWWKIQTEDITIYLFILFVYFTVYLFIFHSFFLLDYFLCQFHVSTGLSIE